VLNSILCLSPYVGSDTKIGITIKKDLSSVRIEMKFSELSKRTPELSKLLKFIYSYYTGVQYNVRIGLEIPFASFKKIGGIINASQRNENTEMNITISLPSYDFLKTVSDIRKTMSDVKSDNHNGVIVVSLSDGMLDMIIRENLAEYGYTIKSSPPDCAKFRHDDVNVKAYIVEESACPDIQDSIMSTEGNDTKPKIIVIAKNGNDRAGDCRDISYVRPPFEIQAIVDIIECTV
ncbi:MAG TPA: hypothetical protein VF857_00680, partial [Spirochaetota bacterium]